MGRIRVEGGTQRQKTIFYTALYRVMLGSQSIDLTEQGGRYYSRFDKQVHETGGHNFYKVGSNWGSHHSLFPLCLLIEPEIQNDLMRSYVRMQQEGDWLVNSGGFRNMIGRHETATITDAYMKGYRDFDIETAYEAMKRNSKEATMLSRPSTNDWRGTELDKVYWEKGFFPAKPSDQPEWVKEVGFGRQSVAITLENCYDDWCMSILAKELDKEEDYQYYLKRALNYQNVFDTATGFMRPKTADGRWIEPFDPIWSGGQGGREFYTENNGWNYTWYVPHDVEGLIGLMGGREKFTDKLQTMFETNVPLYQKYDFLKQYPDMTGWIGMYSHGNEITWHIPYLYNYAGQPWMTQRRVRQIMDVWYGDGPLGYCGDEDYGEMASWYVLSAMGFYTVAPGRPVYDIGCPLFENRQSTSAAVKPLRWKRRMYPHKTNTSSPPRSTAGRSTARGSHTKSCSRAERSSCKWVRAPTAAGEQIPKRCRSRIMTHRKTSMPDSDSFIPPPRGRGEVEFTTPARPHDNVNSENALRITVRRFLNLKRRPSSGRISAVTTGRGTSAA